FPHARKNGAGWKCRCPAHDDGTPSLSIAEGNDGRVLLKCHAGCETVDVLAKVGLKLADLYPPKDRPAAGGVVLTAYDYTDEEGHLLFQAVRRQQGPKKTFFQRRPGPGGGWVNDLKGVRLVPYRLPGLVAADRAGWALVCEGEKDADRAAALGWTATTSPMGAGKWRAEFAPYFRELAVAVAVDNDAAGEAHAADVIASLEPVAAVVVVVRFPDLGSKGDLSDWLDAGGTMDQLGRALDGEDVPGLLVQTPGEFAAERDSSDPGKSAYVHCADDDDDAAQLPEFPVGVFPEPVRRFVEDGAAILNVPPDMIAVPVLGFAAGTIGNTRAVLVKPGWVERANLWLAIVGQPGSGKSPAVDYARAPLDHLQRGAWERYQAEVGLWEQAVAEAKRQKGRTEPPPDRPVLEHFFTTDATTEALASMLSTSPGVAVVRDELTGWVNAFDAYRAAGDRQAYLSLWAGAPLKVDRKGAGTTYVPHPCVPIIGGVQPDMLPDLGEEAGRRDGFVERLLVAWPVARPIRWTEATPDEDAAREVAAIFYRLRGPSGSVFVAPLDDDARRTFAGWYEENGRIIESSQGVAAGCYAKFPSQLARIALVLHALRYPDDLRRRIDARTVLDAVEVIEYFRAHLGRVLPAFGGIGSTKSAALKDRIVRVLDKAGGEWVARRELRRGLGNSVPADDVAAALAALEAEGRAENRTVPT
ncbi:MAG: DUF3987 domain-containing protein, partial [Chloroflexota bacterium]|nr:DUF3987 domain-containing protein [Chloroflexota bacterium]